MDPENAARRVRLGELSYQLDGILEKLRAEFSYRRVEGLQLFGVVLHAVADADILLFREVLDREPQNRCNQFVTQILKGILSMGRGSEASVNCPTFSAVGPNEIELGLQVLLGLCVMHPRAKLKVRELNGIATFLRLVKLVEHKTIPLLALDNLLAVIVDSSANQQIFLRKHGVAEIMQTVRSPTVPIELRKKAATFLAIAGGCLDERMTDAAILDGESSHVPNYTDPYSPRILAAIRSVLPQKDKLEAPLLACVRPSESAAFIALLDETLHQA